jgi:hypothetical protein
MMLVALCVLSAPPAEIQAAPVASESDIEAALALLARDPPIADIQKAAVDYFRVSPGDVTGYRAAARLKALLPALSGSYAFDDNRLTRLSTDQAVFGRPFDPSDPQNTFAESGLGRAFAASATWNLQPLVFDPAELEAYALVGIQEDVVKEVTRLYFTRQHNLLAMALDPPKDPRAKAALILRTRELEAMLDAMTGGAFSAARKK